MFLKTLSISSDSGLIREIHFHEGINLIIDETPSASGRETGNNVGKTTVLALIDFCLGGNAKNIYTDPENKKSEYKLVKDFLVDNNVLVTLVLKDDLSIPESREVRIERNFRPRSQIVRRVDGADLTAEEFEEELTNVLFPGHYGNKPTFRQLISHNIRYKDLAINNTLKTLDAFTRDDEYETLYLFMLGCNFDHGSSKQDILTKLRLELSFKARLEQDQTRSAYETALNILNDEIETLDNKKSALNLNEHFEADMDKLNHVRYQLNVLSSEIGGLRIRQSTISEVEKDLMNGTSKIDLQQLESIYKQATARADSIHKSFQELYEFHNKMISEKVRYITKDLPRLETEIESKTEHLRRLVHEESSLAAAISRSEPFEELEGLITELNDKFRRKGEYENTLRQLSDTEASISELNSSLEAIDDELFSESFELGIKEQVKKLNRHFSAISNMLYGEQYAIKADPSRNSKGQRLYKFSAFNLNFSSGKKQGEISCFDIAYTLFADEEGIPCMHFLLNDKKELMHDNQIVRIANLVNEKGLQLVASILKDKLPDELNRDSYFVVKLSQREKLFRIENDKSAGMKA